MKRKADKETSSSDCPLVATHACVDNKQTTHTIVEIADTNESNYGNIHAIKSTTPCLVVVIYNRHITFNLIH